MKSWLRPSLAAAALAAALAAAAPAHAAGVEWHGLLDLRAVLSDAERSWTHAGLGKSRADQQSSPLRLGQAFLAAQGDLSNAVAARLVLSAADDRAGALDINEAWLLWSPIPASAWKTRVKLGAFFPATSLEIDYDSIGWTPVRTVSSSAINSWIGEELRTLGAELSLVRKGSPSGSPHDYGFNLGVFGANDPAGTLLAWRGWSVSDRITGLTESLQLADLPVYRPDGPINKQTRHMHVFRELDGRAGYYVGGHYGYAERIKVAAMHYDNRADPLVVKSGQYGWHTRFDHLSLQLRPAGQWELAAQAMAGETLMGPQAVRVKFKAWYLLASHPLAQGQLSARYDSFSASENDILPSDPNAEDGQALALAYALPLGQGWSLVSEALVIKSTRPARLLIGAAPAQTERSLSVSLRWQF
ncbi:hypothetical protein [Roseateles sp.]|uniref:hypothetical protein n=1 Tax=Roseateles sp. TaxID=1971397 RepID=UPI00286C39AC|nr:hypothetical protein [Roseateles sp.]